VQVALRCLIVDGSQDFREAARALLEQGGMNVVAVASTGEEALVRAHELRPDVTLLDIDLGGESGFDVVQELVDDGSVDARCVILISVHAKEEFADLIEASPAVGFLSKSDLSVDAVGELLNNNGPIES
jgi:two-component system, NarL family, nitrate/nitrite response regulator NarL